MAVKGRETHSLRSGRRLSLCLRVEVGVLRLRFARTGFKPMACDRERPIKFFASHGYLFGNLSPRKTTGNVSIYFPPSR